MTVSQNQPCPAIDQGTPNAWGDIDCSDSVDAVDALKILRWVSEMKVLQYMPCDVIGEPIQP